MAITAALCFQGHNNLRYKITSTDEIAGPVTIPSTGGPSPDLRTDALAGPIREIARAGIDGIGSVAAGALTQADARDILEADDSGASTGNKNVPRARLSLSPRTATFAEVDVGVDGSANPTITASVGNGVTYLDVEFISGIGA